MNVRDIIRAWKDEQFRKSLSSDELALLPEHPAGKIVLSAEEMACVNGGINTSIKSTCEHTGPPVCTPRVICL